MLKKKIKYNFLILILLILENKQNKMKFYYYSKIIIYKGKKIFKHKLLNDYLSKISNKFKSDKDDERKKFHKYYYLAHYNQDIGVQSELKAKIFREISKIKNQIITKMEILFLSHNINFGNSLITVNNAIFLCEIIGCHKIVLSRNNLIRKWLIQNNIFIRKSNITIMQGSNIDCKLNNILCIYENSWDTLYPKVIIPIVRTDLIKKEILRNLPKIDIQPDSLYIHIRGGDIFKPSPLRFYAQPPLCFYEKIIKNNNFKNIFIVSMDTLNIVVNTLTTKYKNIIFNKHNLEYDIALLCYAYKIVLSVSSFSISAIKLNDNLEDIWEYDIMRLNQKLLFLHHHLFKFNIKYKIHTMRPSDIYASKMFTWKGTNEQIKLMIEENCPNDFVLTDVNK